eukprot:g4630.t1
MSAEWSDISSAIDPVATVVLFERLDEEISERTGQKNLFKRSLILIKAFCRIETKAFSSVPVLGSQEGGLCTYAIMTMTALLFQHYPINHPLQALVVFCGFFAPFNWGRFCVTIDGAVPIRPPSPGSVDAGLQGQEPGFAAAGQTCELSPNAIRACNIQDPVNPNRNIGKSVSSAGLKAMRDGLSHGHRCLSAVLRQAMQGGTNISSAINMFDRVFPRCWQLYGTQSGFRNDLLSFRTSGWRGRPSAPLKSLTAHPPLAALQAIVALHLKKVKEMNDTSHHPNKRSPLASSSTSVNKKNRKKKTKKNKKGKNNGEKKNGTGLFQNNSKTKSKNGNDTTTINHFENEKNENGNGTVYTKGKSFFSAMSKQPCKDSWKHGFLAATIFLLVLCLFIVVLNGVGITSVSLSFTNDAKSQHIQNIQEIQNSSTPNALITATSNLNRSSESSNPCPRCPITCVPTVSNEKKKILTSFSSQENEKYKLLHKALKRSEIDCQLKDWKCWKIELDKCTRITTDDIPFERGNSESEPNAQLLLPSSSNQDECPEPNEELASFDAAPANSRRSGRLVLWVPEKTAVVLTMPSDPNICGTPTWRHNNKLMKGQRSQHLSLWTGVGAADGGEYTCICGDNVWSAVVGALAPPRVRSTFRKQYVLLGTRLRLEVTTLPAVVYNVTTEAGSNAIARVRSADPLRYDWYRNGIEVPGEHGRVLEVEEVKQGHSGTYYCMVSNAHGKTRWGESVIIVTTNKALVSSTADEVDD